MKKKNLIGNVWEFIIALFLILPLVITFIYSFAGRWISILPENLTFDFYN